jgi:hypothetical protein
MWPFRRAAPPPVSAPVVRDGVAATFERRGVHAGWSWTLRGTAFSIDGERLPDDWLEQSRHALATMEALGPEIRIVVMRHLRGWGPPDAAVYSVRLTPEVASDAFEIVAEADAWGDLAVSIDVAHGAINGALAGD